MGEWGLESHQGVHELVAMQMAVDAVLATVFVECLDCIGGDVLVPDEERHRFCDMGAEFDRCRVVGQDGDCDVVVFHCFVDWTDETAVEVFDGLASESAVLEWTDVIGPGPRADVSFI